MLKGQGSRRRRERALDEIQKLTTNTSTKSRPCSTQRQDSCRGPVGGCRWHCGISDRFYRPATATANSYVHFRIIRRRPAPVSAGRFPNVPAARGKPPSACHRAFCSSFRDARSRARGRVLLGSVKNRARVVSSRAARRGAVGDPRPARDGGSGVYRGARRRAAVVHERALHAVIDAAAGSGGVPVVPFADTILVMNRPTIAHTRDARLGPRRRRSAFVRAAALCAPRAQANASMTDDPDWRRARPPGKPCRAIREPQITLPRTSPSPSRTARGVRRVRIVKASTSIVRAARPLSSRRALAESCVGRPLRRRRRAARHTDALLCSSALAPSATTSVY